MDTVPGGRYQGAVLHPGGAWQGLAEAGRDEGWGPATAAGLVLAGLSSLKCLRVPEPCIPQLCFELPVILIPVPAPHPLSHQRFMVPWCRWALGFAPGSIWGGPDSKRDQWASLTLGGHSCTQTAWGGSAAATSLEEFPSSITGRGRVCKVWGVVGAVCAVGGP